MATDSCRKSPGARVTPAIAAWSTAVPAGRAASRVAVTAGAAVTAAAHIPVIGPHLAEAPYMGMLFIALTVAMLFIGELAINSRRRITYLAAALTAALAIVGYAATRTVAFPLLSDDVGNWVEPLGIVCVIAEAVVLISALAVLRPRR